MKPRTIIISQLILVILMYGLSVSLTRSLTLVVYMFITSSIGILLDGLNLWPFKDKKSIILHLTIWLSILIAIFICLSPYLAAKIEIVNNIRDVLLDLGNIVNIIISLIYGVIAINLSMIIKTALNTPVMATPHSKNYTINQDLKLDFIRDLIAKNKIEEAIAELKVVLKKTNNKAALKVLRTISARYYRITRNNSMGISNNQTDLNQINFGLLELIDDNEPS